MKLEFDHVGIVTNEKKEKESYVEATKVWVTNPKEHPFNVEWLRFEDDTPVEGPVRNQCHVAYRVDSIEEVSAGLKVLIEPFNAGENLRVGFFQSDDGAVIEFMEYKGDVDEWI